MRSTANESLQINLFVFVSMDVFDFIELPVIGAHASSNDQQGVRVVLKSHSLAECKLFNTKHTSFGEYTFKCISDY